MNLKAHNQTTLYGLDKYLLNFIKFYKNKNFPNKILLSGDKGSGKSTLAYHFVNYVLSQKEEFEYDIKNFKINSKNKSFQLAMNGSNPNLIIIDTIKEKKNIDIDQIRELILILNKSSFNKKERFVIIDNIETLNISSINALLKILEEPPKNTFFILVNNSRFILPTLKSRCIDFKIFLNHKETLSITNKLFNDDISKYINKDLLSYFFTPGYIYKIVTFFKSKDYDLKELDIKEFLKLIINNNLYKKDAFIRNIAFEYFELFFRQNIGQFKLKTFDYYSYFLKRINDTKRFNLDEESLFLELRKKVLNG